MQILDGRVAIVTGGGRGIGRSHCLALAAQGAHVVVNDVGASIDGSTDENATPADEVAAEIRASGGQAIADTTSVTDEGGVRSLVARTVNEFGHLDVVVNNAGVLRDRMLVSMTPTDWDAVLAVHVTGTFNLVHHAAAHWRSVAKQGLHTEGRIVNTTSGTGLFGNVGQANYGAAKAAIANLTVIAAMELERYGVTANAISPIARTRMTDGLDSIAATDPSEGWDRFEPSNSSPVVAWLASTASGWLTGAVLRVDGATVSRVRPWTIDAETAYRSRKGQRLEAEELDIGLRRSFGVAPGQ